MAMDRATMAAWRVAQQLRLGAAAITLRRYTVRDTDTGEPLRNPPDIRGEPVIAAPAVSGATTISLEAPGLVGYLAPDDKVFITGLLAPVTVADIAEAAANTVTVTLNEPLPDDIAPGTAVTLVYAADLPMLARVSEGQRVVQDGQLTDIRSMNARISAFEVTVEPEAQWTVFLPNGLEHPIVSVKPNVVEGIAATYDIQLRLRG